jgi:hypothetical protein
MARFDHERRLQAFTSAWIRVVFVLVSLVGLAGCASTESDIPWNAPQPWEGTPGIPGFTPDQSR